MSSKTESPLNSAAYLTAEKVYPFQVKSAPYTSPQEHEIVIKNGAVAINPIDWIKQGPIGNMVFPWIKLPFILGTDVAGEVVEVGGAVTRFKIGDRVVAHAVGTGEKFNTSTKSAFQIYTVLVDHMTSPIPDTMPYETAAVMPLGASTAACGLYQTDQLALQLPSVSPKPTSKTLLIWGGSTSVGSNAIQLAVASGYEVVTTASPKNFEYVKTLGASQAFDYNSKTVITDVIHAFKGKNCAGALSIGHGAAEACLDILGKCQGDRFLAMASYPTPQPPPKYFVLLQTIYAFAYFSIATYFKCRARSIRTKYIVGSTLVDNEVGKAVYVDFLPKALADGRYVPAPDPLVVGKGLEYIQPACDVQENGMSAKKVVVSL